MTDDSSGQQIVPAPAPGEDGYRPTFTDLAAASGAPWRVTQKGQAALAAANGGVGLARAPGEE